MTLLNHLLSRFFNPAIYPSVTLNEKDFILTVPLWNLSGKMVGYQQYSPLRGKERKENPKEMRYYTHVSKYGATKELAVWGLETLVDRTKPVFLCEGIFDASRLHWYGLQALSVLGNDPAHLEQWLGIMPFEFIACVQGDKASMSLAKYSTRTSIFLPYGEDVGSLTREMFTKLLQTVCVITSDSLP